MDRNVSIVHSPAPGNYRKVAQMHWGLSDTQMKGKHVHHHPAVSEGGRNVPEHLYVCSPSMHSNGWHSGEYFIEQATLAGQKYGAAAGRIGGKCPWWTKDGEDVRAWEPPGEGWSRGKSRTAEVGSLPYWNNGRTNKRSEECPGEGWKPGLAEVWWTDGVNDVKAPECPGEGWKRGRPNSKVNTQKWMCTVTGRVSTAGPLTLYQRSVGVDTSNRVKLVQ